MHAEANLIVTPHSFGCYATHLVVGVSLFLLTVFFAAPRLGVFRKGIRGGARVVCEDGVGAGSGCQKKHSDRKKLLRLQSDGGHLSSDAHVAQGSLEHVEQIEVSALRFSTKPRSCGAIGVFFGFILPEQ